MNKNLLLSSPSWHFRNCIKLVLQYHIQIVCLESHNVPRDLDHQSVYITWQNYIFPDSQFPDGFDDTLPLISNSSNPWYRKWLLLTMFCCLAFLQMSVFVAWNPISNSALVVLIDLEKPSLFKFILRTIFILKTANLTFYSLIGIWSGMGGLYFGLANKFGNNSEPSSAVSSVEVYAKIW